MAATVGLREVRVADLRVFFAQQLDDGANEMAAFTLDDPEDWEAFQAHWGKILEGGRVVIRTVLAGNLIAGYILSHDWFGKPEVSYWIGRSFWGKGVATQALEGLLDLVQDRPLFARVVKDNIASIRVLEKCGFIVCGEDKGFSNARGREVEEYVYKLDVAEAESADSTAETDSVDSEESAES